MKLQINKERITFYLWTTSAYLLLWLIVDLAQHPVSFFQYAVNEIWRAVYILLVMFLFFEYTIPRLNKKNKIKSISLLAIQIFLFSFGLFAWRYLGIQLHIYNDFASYTSCKEGVGDQFGSSIFAILFFAVIRHFHNYRKLRADAQQLRIEKQEAELSYLKSQTNPHFLFNTLNNIYSLARDKSDLAPESILRLSKILRFMLYETGGAYIAIEQELKIINDYIALEKLRYDDTLSVNFNYDIEDMKQALPPLLLIPLVENAFKHGVSETRNQPFVDIHLSVNNRLLIFVVKNSTEKFPEDRSAKENIGLSNLRRQLELLYKDFNLSVQQGESVFTASLKINLASHV
ncbi:MAG: histidine kinase [Ignavibacteriales bacterium]|nr:histidine kinase [Ignavibacteriales bacterium]